MDNVTCSASDHKVHLFPILGMCVESASTPPHVVVEWWNSTLKRDGRNFRANGERFYYCEEKFDCQFQWRRH